MTGAGFDIVPRSEVDDSALVDAISAAFGVPRTLDWFQWKHVDGPWGPSTGWVAVDGDGVLGLRLFTPWDLAHGGRTVTAQRAMDGAVVPRAQRRGIFRALVQRQLDVGDQLPGGQLLLSTAVPASREAYRSLGWTVFDPIEHEYRIRPPRLRSGSFVEHRATSIGGWEVPRPEDHRFRTAWTADALRWRVDPRSGRRYRLGRLEDGAGPNGIIWREVPRRSGRLVSVVHCWGSEAERRRLVAGALRASRTIVTVEVHGPAGSTTGRGPSRRRPASHIAIWTTPSASHDGGNWHGARDRSRWDLSFADLEGAL